MPSKPTTMGPNSSSNPNKGTVFVYDLVERNRDVQSFVDLAKANGDAFEKQVRQLVDTKVTTSASSSVKARLFTAAWVTGRRTLTDFLINSNGFLTISEVLKSVLFLDTQRRINQITRKLEIFSDPEKKKKGRKRMLIALRMQLANYQNSEFLKGVTLTGAKIKTVRKWCIAQPASFLEFVLMTLPSGPWCDVADVCHLRPSDFQLNYFLHTVHGKEAPAGSMVAIGKSVNYVNVGIILELYPSLCECFSFLRVKLGANIVDSNLFMSTWRALVGLGYEKELARVAVKMPGNHMDVEKCSQYLETHLEQAQDLVAKGHGAFVKEFSRMPNMAMAKIARKAPLEDVLWFFEELECSETKDIVMARLNHEEFSGDSSRGNYGKLMERLLMLREKKSALAPVLLTHAEKSLQGMVQQYAALKECARVAVLGDASASMQVAVKCAASIGSLLSAVFEADLVFFNNKAFDPPGGKSPRTAAQAIQVAEGVRASGCTNMACSLDVFYQKRQMVDLFILVSDEGENQYVRGMNIAQLFKQYKEEVNENAEIFLISFLNTSAVGAIMRSLEKEGIEYMQYKLDSQRPDTSKFDALLGQVALAAEKFTM